MANPKGNPNPKLKKGGPSLNPAGRPKGSKNSFPTALKDKVLYACAALEAKGQDLAAVALKDPEWFYVNFVKPMLPKELAVTGEGGGALCVVIKDLRIINGKGD